MLNDILLYTDTIVIQSTQILELTDDEILINIIATGVVWIWLLCLMEEYNPLSKMWEAFKKAKNAPGDSSSDDSF